MAVRWGEALDTGTGMMGDVPAGTGVPATWLLMGVKGRTRGCLGRGPRREASGFQEQRGLETWLDLSFHVCDSLSFPLLSRPLVRPRSAMLREIEGRPYPGKAGRRQLGLLQRVLRGCTQNAAGLVHRKGDSLWTL